MKSSNNPRPLTRAELTFWKAAFVAAELSLLKQDSLTLTPAGAAHLASEFAQAAVLELRRVRGSAHGRE